MANAAEEERVRSERQRIGEAYSFPLQRLFDEDIKGPEFLVPGAIPRKSVIVISGPPGSKKTWVVYDLARAVSTGTPWMGRGPACEKRENVLIFNYDMPTPTIKDRVGKLQLARDNVFLHTHDLSIVAPGQPKELKLPNMSNTMRAVVEYREPSLIIVDSLRQSHFMDENSSQEMAQLMGIFKTFCEWGATVMLVHHTSKKEGGWTQARGSGEIIGSADVAMETRSQGEMEPTDLVWTKARAWQLDLDTTKFDVMDDENEERTFVRAKTPLPGEAEFAAIDRVVEALAKNGRDMSRKEIRVATGLMQNVVAKAIDRGIAAGKIKSVRGGSDTRKFKLV